MIHTANRKTASVTVVSPRPNRIIRIGTSAESGAADEDVDPHPEQAIGGFGAPHQDAERHADEDRESHAEGEGAQGDRSGVPERGFGDKLADAPPARP